MKEIRIKSRYLISQKIIQLYLAGCQKEKEENKINKRKNLFI